MSIQFRARPVRHSTNLELVRSLDRCFTALGLRRGAVEKEFPALISRELLIRAEYPAAFPHLILSACPCSDPGKAVPELFANTNMVEPKWCLSPTVCHHVYPLWEGQPLAGLQIITACGRCFRHEHEFRDGQRQLEFDMREIVFAGPEEEVEVHLAALQGEITVEAEVLGVEGQWQAAVDPFFMPVARMKAMQQQAAGAKIEFVSGPNQLALASINRHRRHFAEMFGISMADGREAVTACVAFGIDRWAHRAKKNGETA